MRIACVGGRSVVTSSYASSPLRLLTPSNHGAAAWVYLTSLGGGLVDGDEVALDVDVGAGATAFVTTQSFTKAYRSKRLTQKVTVRIAEGALLAWVPDPLLCFAGASLAQSATIELHARGSLIHAEILAAGRSAEHWSLRRLTTRLALHRDGAPVLVDAMNLDPFHGALAPRMGKLHALATLVAIGPRTEAVRERITTGATSASSPFSPDGTLIRVGGESVEHVAGIVRELLAPLRCELGDDPFARKW